MDALAMGQFVQALRRGATVGAAAKAAGVARSAFYRLRKKDPEFAAVWAEALALSDAPTLIRPGNGRRLQLRKTRQLRFTEAKKALFLSYFAGTCDLATAADSAGVCVTTVRNHRRTDPQFAADYQSAVEQGYAALEEAVLRERLAAERKLKAGIVPAGEAAAEFERQMKLLAQWRRRDGSVGPRDRRKAALETWSFDAAMAALEKRLRALNIPVEGEEEQGSPAPPPAGHAR